MSIKLPISEEKPTLIIHTNKEIKANLIPKTPPLNNRIQSASLVPRLPGIKDGINVTIPNNKPR